MNKKSIRAYWWNGRPNAGDVFTRWLLAKMGYNVSFTTSPQIVVTGSILAESPINKNTKIWGVGYHNAFDRKLNLDKNKVFAVRGKLTANKLGINCVTGDPGILASKFYIPNTTKKFKYGFIPHYVDFEWAKSLKLPGVKIINIGTSNLEKLFDEINECEFIFSSSLHGIIFSHSFGIPAFHIKHNELASKKSFKFLDYYSNFNLKYLMKITRTKADFKFDEFEVLYNNRNLFVPTKEEIEQNQNSLLSVFPFK